MNQDKENLQETFRLFLETVQAKNVSETVKYLSPKLFEYYPQQDFISLIQLQYEEQVLEPANYKILEVSDIIEENKVKYSKIIFNQDYYLDLSMYKNQGNVEVLLKQILPPFENQFGKKNVFFDSNSYRIEIKSRGEVFAVLYPDLNEWRFFTENDLVTTGATGVLPESIRKKI